MTKDKLLKIIADNAYNVGFGAKKNFSSHDIILKLPNWLGFISLAIGILQLGYNQLGSNKILSFLLIISSLAILYINLYNSNLKQFEDEGNRLTKLFNRLKALYFSVQSQSKHDYTIEITAMDLIMEEFYSATITKQVFLSQWYAHYKFFYEMQIDWVDEQLKFSFFKDKIPSSLKVTILFFLIILLIYYGYR
jgi:hypothetical protein